MKRSLPSVVALVLVAAPLWGQGDRANESSVPAGPAGVSPGGSAGFELAEVCPTFSWTAVAEAGYELSVYRIDGRGQLASVPALEARLPVGATSWTPPMDRCLAAGERYGWSVRATTTDRVGGQWSEALLFQVAEAPVDLAAALEVLRHYLGPDALAAALSSAAPPGAAAVSSGPGSAEAEAGLPPTQKTSGAAQQHGGAPAIAIRGEVPDGAGETYGVRGVSNSPDGAGVRADNNTAGADLVLGGSPPAEITQSSFSRASAGNLTFDFTNPGAGTMTLQVDGSSVVTGAADDWVNETGDTMTGTLTLSPAAGNALTTTAGDVALHGAATLTKGGSRFLWDDAGNASFGAGRGALAGNTTGASNTAVGTGALDANTTGGDNVAVGTDALGANTTAHSNTAVGAYALDANTFGNSNVALGRAALGANTMASYNTAIGAFALEANTSGNNNVALGRDALKANTTANFNTAVGANALDDNTTGGNNVALGARALGNDTTGIGNTALGYAAGFNVTTTGNNIFIDNQGVTGDANRIRIGDTQTEAFLAGVHGMTPAGPTKSVVVNAGGQLGSTAGGAGSGLNADLLDGLDSTAFVVEAGDTMSGTLTLSPAAGNALTTTAGDVVLHTGATVTKGGSLFLWDDAVTQSFGAGRGALASNTGGSNTAVGTGALAANTSGDNNTALGLNALSANTTAEQNTAIGAFALDANTTGTGNVAVGRNALGSNTTGSFSTALGNGAGSNVTDTGNNIFIDHLGVAGDSNLIRIGSGQIETFIAGIFGNATAGGLDVVVTSSGELGSVGSSRRFKEEIADVGAVSERLLALRPVSFRYTKEAAGEGERPLEYGLIAEEVAEVFPELVVYDEGGEPYTVRYHLLVPLLLAEARSEHARTERQERELAAQRATIARQEATLQELLARLGRLEHEREPSSRRRPAD